MNLENIEDEKLRSDWLLEDIYRAEAQIEAGEGISHAEAKDRILKQLRQYYS